MRELYFTKRFRDWFLILIYIVYQKSYSLNWEVFFRYLYQRTNLSFMLKDLILNKYIVYEPNIKIGFKHLNLVEIN